MQTTYENDHPNTLTDARENGEPHYPCRTSWYLRYTTYFEHVTPSLMTVKRIAKTRILNSYTVWFSFFKLSSGCFFGDLARVEVGDSDPHLKNTYTFDLLDI